MKAFIIVGATKMGKTSWMREKLAQVPNKNAIMIYDVNNEYSDFYPYPFLDSEDKFLEKVNKVNNAVIVLEEASIYFDVQTRSSMMKKLLVGKRHTNNTYFLIFHSFSFIPAWVYRLANHIVIFKTLDGEKYVYKRFENEGLSKAYKQIEDAPYLTAPDGSMYSPHLIYDVI